MAWTIRNLAEYVPSAAAPPSNERHIVTNVLGSRTAAAHARRSVVVHGALVREAPAAPPSDRPLAGRIVALRELRKTQGIVLHGAIPRETPLERVHAPVVMRPVRGPIKRALVRRGQIPHEVPAAPVQDRPPQRLISAGQVRVERRGAAIHQDVPRATPLLRIQHGQIVGCAQRQARGGLIVRGAVPRDTPSAPQDRIPRSIILAARSRRIRPGELVTGAQTAPAERAWTGHVVSVQARIEARSRLVWTDLPKPAPAAPARPPRPGIITARQLAWPHGLVTSGRRIMPAGAAMAIGVTFTAPDRAAAFASPDRTVALSPEMSSELTGPSRTTGLSAPDRSAHLIVDPSERGG